LHRFGVGCVDAHLATVVFIDINIGTGYFGDAADVFTTWTD